MRLSGLKWRRRFLCASLTLGSGCEAPDTRRGPLADLSFMYVPRMRDALCTPMVDSRWPTSGILRACTVATDSVSRGFLVLDTDALQVLETGEAVVVADRKELTIHFDREVSRLSESFGPGYQLCLAAPSERTHRWRSDSIYATVNLDSIASRITVSSATGDPPAESRCPSITPG